MLEADLLGTIGDPDGFGAVIHVPLARGQIGFGGGHIVDAHQEALKFSDINIVSGR